MLDQLKNDMLKIKDWCENNKKLSIIIAVALTLIIGSGLILGEMFDNGDNEFRYKQTQQVTNQQTFKTNSTYERDGGGDDTASLNPQLAIINLLIISSLGAIVGAGVFLHISSNKKNVKPLPVLYNPIKNDDKEAE